jgi:hypothetical protein
LSGQRLIHRTSPLALSIPPRVFTINNRLKIGAKEKEFVFADSASKERLFL